MKHVKFEILLNSHLESEKSGARGRFGTGEINLEAISVAGTLRKAVQIKGKTEVWAATVLSGEDLE